jgi:hypothetical protein
MLTAPSQFLIGKPARFEVLYQAPPFDAYLYAASATSGTSNAVAARVLINPSNGFPFAARFLRFNFAANVSGLNTAWDNGGATYVGKWKTSPNGETALPPTGTTGPDIVAPVLLTFAGSASFVLPAGHVIQSDFIPFSLAQGDALVLQFLGFAAATFSAPGVRTFIVGVPDPRDNIAYTGAKLASVACAGLLSIEGMR